MNRPAIMVEEPQNNIRDFREDDEMISEDAFITPNILNKWILNLIIRFMNFSFYLLALCLNILYNLSLVYILIYCLIADAFLIISKAYSLRTQNEKLLKTRLKIDISETLIMVVFKISLLLYVTSFHFLITFTIIFLLFHLLLRLFLYMTYKNKSECFGMLDFLSVLWRTFLICLIFGMFLKFDGFLYWSYKQVLLPFWILFSLEIGLNFVVLLMIISKLMQKYYEKVENCEIIGLFWIFFQTLYYLLTGYFFLEGIVNELDSKQPGYFLFYLDKTFLIIDELEFLMIFVAVSLSIFLVYSFSLRNNILAFLILVSKIDQEVNDNNSQGNQGSYSNSQSTQNQNFHPPPKKKKKKNRGPLAIPKYLVNILF